MKNKKKKKLKILVHPAFQKQMGIKPSEKCRPLEECIKESEIRDNKWYIKYLYYPFHWYFWSPIIGIPNGIKNHTKWFYQRRIRGFDDSELWDLQFYLKKWLAPRLERWLKKETWGYPNGLTPTKWNNILKKILWLARDSEKEENELWSGKCNKKDWKNFYKKQREASELLGKYLGNLWD